MAKKGQKRGQQARAAANRKDRRGGSAASPGPSGRGADGGRVRGLANLGNTCFLNSILQCLNASAPFSDQLVALSKDGLTGLGASLCSVFRGIRGEDTSNTKGNAVSPKPLLAQLTSRFPWYKGNEQQDAHELLRTLLGSVSDELTTAERKVAKTEKVRKATGAPTGCCEKAVWDSFRGHLCAGVFCWGCNQVSLRLDPFLDLSLELLGNAAPPGPLGIPAAAREPLPLPTSLSSAAPAPSGAGSGKAKAASAAASAKTVAAEAVEPGEDEEEEAEDEAEDGEAEGSFRQHCSKKQKRKQRLEAAEEARRTAAAAAAAAVEAAAATAREAARMFLADLLERLYPKEFQRKTEAQADCSNGVASIGEGSDGPREPIPGDQAAEEPGSDAQGAEEADAAAAPPADMSEPPGGSTAADGLRGGSGNEDVKLQEGRTEEEEGEEREVTVADARADADSEERPELPNEGNQEQDHGAPGQLPEAPSGEEDQKSAPSAPSPACPAFEVELNRDSCTTGRWGFGWNEDLLSDGILVLHTILEDSILDKWNLKCKTLGDEDSVVRPGDCVTAVNGHDDLKRMRKEMRNEFKIVLQLTRGGAPAAKARATSSKSTKSGKSKGTVDSDGDDAEDRRERALQRERCRQLLWDTAASCDRELPEALRDAFGTRSAAKVTGGRAGLPDCLRRFCSVEALEDDFRPTYKCSECARRAKQSNAEAVASPSFASRRIWIWPKLPPLLTVQLKRFQRRGSRFEKSSESVDVPVELDLSAYVITEAEHQRLSPFLAKDSSAKTAPPATSAASLNYELYAMCVHQGASMQAGHYVAYVNAGESLQHEDWYGISDGHVWNSTRAEALKVEAYVAFYRRVGFRFSASPEQAEGDDAGADSPTPEPEADEDAAEVDEEAEVGLDKEPAAETEVARETATQDTNE